MNLGGIIILLVLLISLIAFIYIIVKSARGWGGLHVTLLCILFIECWTFMFLAAGVQDTRVRFTEQAHVNRERAEDAADETIDRQWGDFALEEDNPSAVVPLQGELRRMTNDRGRVWRGVNLVGGDDSSGYQMELSAADNAASVDNLAADADPVLAALSSESLPVNLVIYAFAEEIVTDDDTGGAGGNERPVPSYYLGEYTVTQSQDGAVTLQPTLPLLPSQTQAITNGAASSWTLYELLPLDSHRAFAARGSKETDEENFGHMDADTLNELFSNIPGEDNRQQQVIDAYLRDGSRADPNDPAESVWVQVNMLKPYSLDVDSDQSANATERGYFDVSGRSIDSRLKRSDDGSVELSPDMRETPILLKEEAARDLIDQGIAELVQRIYVRPLVDYEAAFNNHAIRMDDVRERIATLQREKAIMDAANRRSQQLISNEQVEFGKLNEDLANFQREIDVLNESIQSAGQELTALKTELSSLFRQIQAQSR